MPYRMALRRTQKDVDSVRVKVTAQTLSYRELQQLAVERGIPANQSADALREALNK